MSFDWGTYGGGLGIVMVMAVATWLISIPKRDVSIVDSVWSLMFLAAGWWYWAGAPAHTTRAGLVLTLLSLWALRLSVYITWRNRGEGEDRRYQEIRRNNERHFALKSLYIVFALQAVLAWIVSLPLAGAIASGAPLGLLDLAGAGLWVCGMIFEVVGDWQLARFKSRAANRGRVLDRGLWRYTRHPNYFGEFCVWWGFFLMAASAGAWWTVIGPLLMSFLLLRVSGVVLLEKDIAERRPAYRDYIQHTNAFFPGPRRAGAATGVREESTP